MTTVTFYSEGSRLTGLEMKGHSGYAPQGGDASISLKLPKALDSDSESVCQTLLAALLVHCVQLAEEYPENITVLEV